MKKYNTSLGILKIISMLLIINSHIDVLYPSNCQFLASGGAVGNELFFLLSGYFFSVKSDKCKDIAKRFLRLYIPTWIMAIVRIIWFKMDIADPLGVIKAFLWPTVFWFVSAVFAFSVILYFLAGHARIHTKKGFLIFAAVIIAVDVLMWVFLIKDKSIWIVEDAVLFNGFFFFKCVYSLFVYVLGYFIKQNEAKILKKVNHPAVIVLAVITFISTFAFKFLLNKGIIPMEAQIISQPLTIICVVCIFLSFAKWSISDGFAQTKLGGAIRAAGDLTLEAYLVQFVLIDAVSRLGIVFPVNILLVIAVILLAAWILRFVDKQIYKALLRLFKLNSKQSC